MRILVGHASRQGATASPGDAEYQGDEPVAYGDCADPQNHESHYEEIPQERCHD